MSWDFPSDLLKACVAMTATKHVFDKVESILHVRTNILSDETKDEDGECSTCIHSTCMLMYTQLEFILLLLFRDGH